LALARRARLDGLIDMLLARPSPWAALGSAAALGASVGVPIAVVVNGFDSDPTPFQAAVVGGLLGGGSGGMAMLFVGLRREDARMMVQRRCLGCGERVELDAVGCGACGRLPLPGQWVDMPFPRWGDVRKAWMRPMLGAAATLLLLFVLWLAFMLLAARWLTAQAFGHWMLALEKGMPTVIDSSILCVVVALTIDRARHRSARRADAADQWCLACGQDLRGTPSVRGTGRCGECGASFVRL
jgi:hypothetical protein